MLSHRRNSLVGDESDDNSIKLRFDVSNYKPEEVTVRANNNHIHVHAKHEENKPNYHLYRESSQEYHFPRGTHVENVNSEIGKDGTLTIEASRCNKGAIGY